MKNTGIVLVVAGVAIFVLYSLFSKPGASPSIPSWLTGPRPITTGAPIGPGFSNAATNSRLTGITPTGALAPVSAAPNAFSNLASAIASAFGAKSTKPTSVSTIVPSAAPCAQAALTGELTTPCGGGYLPSSVKAAANTPLETPSVLAAADAPINLNPCAPYNQAYNLLSCNESSPTGLTADIGALPLTSFDYNYPSFVPATAIAGQDSGVGPASAGQYSQYSIEPGSSCLSGGGCLV